MQPFRGKHVCYESSGSKRSPFLGFGLNYHLGYGYGGAGVGVGPDGGYPDYGGPGYPHCEPPLQRFGPIAPFQYFGGPGYPTANHPNYFGGVGPLVSDLPVITVEDHSAPTGDYGMFNGMVPYDEATFAPRVDISITDNNGAKVDPLKRIGLTVETPKPKGIGNPSTSQPTPKAKVVANEIKPVTPAIPLPIRQSSR